MIIARVASDLDYFTTDGALFVKLHSQRLPEILLSHFTRIKQYGGIIQSHIFLP